MYIESVLKNKACEYHKKVSLQNVSGCQSSLYITLMKLLEVFQLNPIFSTVKSVRWPWASPSKVPKLFVRGFPPLLAWGAGRGDDVNI